MTEHPCKNLTNAQRRAFERIAIGQNPECRWSIIDVLLRAGGIYEIPSFVVPIPIHMQWCQWCSENCPLEIIV